MSFTKYPLFERKFCKVYEPKEKHGTDFKLKSRFACVCGIFSGLDELQDIVTYGKSDIAFFKETFGIEKTPSKSTLTRVMNLVDGEIVAEIIINIMRETLGVKGEVLAFDGKTICATPNA